MTSDVMIAPSILAADFTRLGEEVREVEAAGAEWLHVDVMDGQFVPNITMGPLVVAALRRATRLPLDVHLMIVEPERYLDAFAQAGADQLYVHVETCPHLHRTLQYIRGLGKRAGVVLNPATPTAALSEVLDMVDTVLVMSVNPGFTGQTFMPAVLGKAEQAAAWRRQHGGSFQIEMDGGLHAGNVTLAWKAGVDVVVAGAAVMRKPDFAAAIRELKEA